MTNMQNEITVYKVEVQILDGDGRAYGWNVVGERTNESDAIALAAHWKNRDMTHGMTRITPLTRNIRSVYDEEIFGGLDALIAFALNHDTVNDMDARQAVIDRAKALGINMP